MNEKLIPIRSGWTTALGVLMVAMGLIAIMLPIAATLELSWLMGAVFLVSGVSQLIHAFRFDVRRSRACRMLMSVVSIVAGVLTLRNLFAGALTITIVMAFSLLSTLATSSWVIPGTFVSVDFMIYGFTLIALASEQRRSQNHADFEETLEAA